MVLAFAGACPPPVAQPAWGSPSRGWAARSRASAARVGSTSRQRAAAARTASSRPGNRSSYTTLTAVGGTATILAITEGATLAGAIDTPSLGDVGAVWWQTLFVIFLGALVAVIAWNEGVRRLGAPNAALFMNLVPVVAFAIAVVFQGYHSGAGELAGAAVTIGALAGANLASRPAPRPQAAPARASRRERIALAARSKTAGSRIS